MSQASLRFRPGAILTEAESRNTINRCAPRGKVNMHTQGTHFDGEAPHGARGGIDARYAQLHKATGKTISKVKYGEDPSARAGVHHGEYLVLEFTDGTALQIQIATDVLNLQEAGGKFRASALTCSFMPLYREDGTVSLV